MLPLGETHLGAFPHATERNTISVAMSTLDAVFKDTVLPRPILLKIDVQGYEHRVLLGAVKLLNQVDHVVIEASLRPLYDGETLFGGLVDLLMACGFQFKTTVGRLHDPSNGELLQIDALFERDPR
jgi:hypothetical protein